MKKFGQDKIVYGKKADNIDHTKMCFKYNKTLLPVQGVKKLGDGEISIWGKPMLPKKYLSSAFLVCLGLYSQVLKNVTFITSLTQTNFSHIFFEPYYG